MFEKVKWTDPPRRYRVKPIIHHWQKDYQTHLDAVEDFGYGGVVTNPDIEGSAARFREDCRDFRKIIDELKKRDLSWFIYDEKGFPSGWGFGETVKNHPELAAKGLYMHRHMAYCEETFSYRIDEDSDKIVWAMVFPMAMKDTGEGFPVRGLDEDKMRPIPFETRSLSTELSPWETLFIFCVRTSQEGTQVANTPAVGPYLNILNPRAVRRFLDIAYEPLAQEVPEAYQGAEAVFTDEPSLMVRHMTPYQNWSFAMVPWCDEILDRYEQEYGNRLEPLLHHLFEGSLEASPERVNYHRLVGKLIGENYTKQIHDWCVEHGTILSGHYLGEESIHGNVLDYGSYIEVLKQSGLPGMDILDCYPEIYNYNAAKHPQIAVRKKGTNGMMAEICPVNHAHEFARDAVNYMSAIIGVLFLGGVRKVNSYFFDNYEEYAPEALKGVRGLLKREDARAFNAYVGRLAYMLDGLDNDCNTFIYYGIEDMQGKYIPSYTLDGFAGDVDHSTAPLVKAIYENGHDFYYADRDDLVDAAACEGFPMISGHEVRTIIVPKMDIFYDESYESLKELAGRGVKVLFLNQLPTFGIRGTGNRRLWNDFVPVSIRDVLEWLDKTDSCFTAESKGNVILKGRYQKEGRELWLVLNHSGKPAETTFAHQTKSHAQLLNPVDGTIRSIRMGETITIAKMRGVFIWFD